MILSSDDIKIVTNHFSPVLKVFNLDFNKPYHFLSLSDNGEIVEWIFDKSRKTFKTEKKKRIEFNLKSNSIFQKYDSNKMYEKDKRLLQEMKKKMEQNFNKRPIFVSDYSTNNLKIIKL